MSTINAVTILSRRNMFIQEGRARGKMNEIEPHLVSAIASAWKRFEGVRKGFGLPRPIVMANMLNNLVEEEVLLHVDRVPGVHVIRHGARFLLGYKGMILQFKKLDSEYRTENFPTPTAEMFDAQESIDEAIDFPRLTIGYRPTRIWDALQEIAVVFARGKRVEYFWQIDGQANPIQMPLRQVARQRRARAKRTGQE